MNKLQMISVVGKSVLCDNNQVCHSADPQPRLRADPGLWISLDYEKPLNVRKVNVYCFTDVR